MSAASLLRELQHHGASVRLSGGSVRLSVPRGSRLPASIVEAARAAKEELAALLSVGSSPCRMDPADEDERAAIVEHDGHVPADYAEEFARLQQWCPAGVPDARWRLFINDGGVFLDRWGTEAVRLGWKVGDLFGLDPAVPLARYDRMGLVWLLKAARVTSLTSTTAVISSGHSYTRRKD